MNKTETNDDSFYLGLMNTAYQCINEFLYCINLHTWELKVLFARDEIRSRLESFKTFGEIKEYFAINQVLPEHREAFMKFANPATFIERGKTHQAYSLEYQTYDEGWVRLTALPAHYDEQGNMDYLMICKTNINEQIKRRTSLTYLSETDALTGIHNRYQGMRLLQAVCDNHEPGVFAYIDIDHFKEVNDTCGHSVGDELIKATARCLQRVFPDQIIFRIGGDEFGFYLSGHYTPDTIDFLSQKLFDAFDAMDVPGLCPKVRNKISLSIGDVQYDGTDGITPDDILLIADKRMYKSKLVNGHHVTFTDGLTLDFKQVLQHYKDEAIEVHESRGESL